MTTFSSKQFHEERLVENLKPLVIYILSVNNSTI